MERTKVLCVCWFQWCEHIAAVWKAPVDGPHAVTVLDAAAAWLLSTKATTAKQEDRLWTIRWPEMELCPRVKLDEAVNKFTR